MDPMGYDIHLFVHRKKRFTMLRFAVKMVGTCWNKFQKSSYQNDEEIEDNNS